MEQLIRFKKRVSGRESELEDLVADDLCALFPDWDGPRWAAASPTIGAGMPDLLLVDCNPQVLRLSSLEDSCDNLLSYLRYVSKARIETIIDRLGYSSKRAETKLKELINLEVVESDGSLYWMASLWRNVLPRIVAIEVKVSDWQKAILQAYRNTIFAHQSFVALPSSIAERIKRETIVKQYGIGVLSINENTGVRIIRSARAQRPKVWSYYYRLASMVARHLG
ncbi:MAG: hypothetical protein GX589_02290 [Deltaproteobacteria bacterium]|nr:hypothetical protein [Deltaproteobacteria bacterium]